MRVIKEDTRSLDYSSNEDGTAEKNIGSRFWARLQNFRIEGKRKRKLLQGLGLCRDNHILYGSFHFLFHYPYMTPNIFIHTLKVLQCLGPRREGFRLTSNP